MVMVAENVPPVRAEDGRSGIHPRFAVAERATYSVDEVAHLLGLSRGLAYQCVRQGQIPAIRVGRRWMVPRKVFQEWLESSCQTEASGSKWDS